jgi:hypothetical protein
VRGIHVGRMADKYLGPLRTARRDSEAGRQLTWTPLHAKRYFQFWITGKKCTLTFGLCVRDELAGPDGMCWSMPHLLLGLLKSQLPFRLNRPRFDL